MVWRKLIFVNLVLATLGWSSGCTTGLPDIAEGRTIVFEGLPHHDWESELRDSEIRSKPTTVLHGNYFYSSFQSVKGKDAETYDLREVLSDRDLFKPFSGEKLCGGFHADYAVAWKEKGQVIEVLICFGCGEVKRYGPGGEIREDMETGTKEKLKKLLKAYDNLRPNPKKSSE